MPLTPQELDTFLSEPHIAVVATAGPTGKPHAMPVWYAWRDGKVLFHTGADSKKMRNLRANPRVSVVVDSKVAPYKVVVIEGRAREGAGDGALATEIAIHYLGEQFGSRYVEQSGGPGTLVTVEPDKIISWDYARESNP
ncbi:MAG: PPOX class F420-dependent oxidoreductase [Chloroflexi bacterium]|nr:PPOX class F420-dependent oxidoreductase [Dehalococcoidia bacterium]MCO5200954.1 PPOX class F420-dependent oxidoreductase [Chloroflexota bacterium]MCZ7578931.1 PPOX class F420-dependent oxidoreductase [Dehalococcoidia bacterium]